MLSSGEKEETVGCEYTGGEEKFIEDGGKEEEQKSRQRRVRVKKEGGCKTIGRQWQNGEDSAREGMKREKSNLLTVRMT